MIARAATTCAMIATMSNLPPVSRMRRAAIYAAVFFAFIDNFALLPVLGPRAQQLGGDPLLVGLAIAAYSLANLAFDPIGGALADRLGRRQVVIAALAMLVAALLAGTLGLAVSTYQLIPSFHDVPQRLESLRGKAQAAQKEFRLAS